MKKLMMGLSMMLLLVACSNDDDLGFAFKDDGKNEVTLELMDDDLDNKITLIADGDDVKKQITTNNASYDHYGVSSKDSAEVAFNDVIKQYRNVDGIHYDVEFTEEEVQEVLEVDFEQVDMDELKEVPGIEFDGNIKKGISLKATVKQLEESGYKIE